MKKLLSKIFGGRRGDSPVQENAPPPVVSEQKKMIAAFEVERKLGAGAMGAVFLGKDPANNREVAIKTMALAKEFDADVLEDIKSRFFREAKIAERHGSPQHRGRV